MMDREIDVTALGELLIDFTENGTSDQGNVMFEANPGGAPCNVLAMLQKLGRKTSFIGKVGNDYFGTLLRNELKKIGICTENLLVDQVAHTTLAFVHNKEDGDRDFSFYRNPGADMCLRKEEIDKTIIDVSKIFHFGTLSFTADSSKEATCCAVEYAREKKKIVSFDPNVRNSLWGSETEIKRAMEYGLKHCDVLKISDDEILFYTGITDYDEAIAWLKKMYQIPLICVTLGKNGSLAYGEGNCAFAEPFVQSDTIETTGAGDTFMACVLNFILNKGLECVSDAKALREMIEYANAAASIITTRRGALKVMPERYEIEELMKIREPQG